MRLFLGLWPDEGVRQALVEHQAAWPWPPGTSVVAPQKLHLTLHFLGDVECHAIEPLQQALHGVRCGELVMDWSQAERWGGGLAVLRTAPNPVLDVLHAQVGEVLRQQALPVETRPFKPHVTLARKAVGAQPPSLLPSRPWQSSGFVLVASVEGRYEVLSRHG